MQKVDKRILRTQRNIRSSFLELLELKAYKNITVQDILDRAQINRTTFYKHYESKSALALQIVNDFKAEFILPIARQRFNFSAQEFIERASPMMNKHRPLIKLLIKIESPEINLLHDIYQLAKSKYIESMVEKTGKLAEELDFQGHC